MNDKTKTKKKNGADGRIAVDRSALTALVGLAKVAAALGTEDAPKCVDYGLAKLAARAAGSFATIMQAAYGIDEDEAAKTAAVSTRIIEMLEKSAKGGAK